MSRWLWHLSRLTTLLWLRASIYGLIAVITALISIFFGHLVPEDLSQEIGADAVDDILNILASSMLAVTIFSVSTMVSAYSAATSNLTPRATKLLMEDKISQNALSTFLGTFIFSIVGIIALKAGIYGASGRLVLFIVTVLVIAMIILTLLRWIEYLSRLGSVSETIELLEKAATAALQERLGNPYMGGTPWPSGSPLPDGGTEIFSDEIGYIQHIDIPSLAELAQAKAGEIYIRAMPGSFSDHSRPIAFATGVCDEKARREIRAAFIIGRERSFRQDPGYGMAALSEVALRALSPAINDPGTAIQVIGVGVRILSLWGERGDYAAQKDAIKFPEIQVPALKVDDLFTDFFPAIARDGAGHLEVATRLQEAFISLSAIENQEMRSASIRHAATSLKRGLHALFMDEDKEKLMQTAERSALAARQGNS